MDQTTLQLADARLYAVSVRFNAWTRHRGVIVTAQHRDAVPKVTRDFAAYRFHEGYTQLHGEVKNLQPGDRLLQPKSLKIMNVQPL